MNVRSRKRVWLVAAAVLTIAAGLGLHLKKPSPFACLAADSWPLVYQVRIDESSASDPDPVSRKLPPSTKSTFVADILFSPSADGNGRLDGRVHPRRYEAGGVTHEVFRDFKSGFSIDFSEGCRIVEVAFDGRETFGARETIQKLLGMLDLGRAGEGAQLKDAFGISEMTRSVEGEVVRFERRAVVAASSADKATPRVDSVVKSSFAYQGSAGPWHGKIDVAEELRIAVASEPLQTLRYAITILHRPAGEGEAVTHHAIPDAHRVAKKPGEAFKGVDKPSVYDAPGDPAKTPLSLEDAINRFLELFDDDPRSAKFALIDFLRAHPEAAAELGDKIRVEYFNDEQLVHVLHAMAKSGVDTAQATFAALIRDPDLDLSSKLRVIFALGELRVPSDEVVEALREHTARLVNEGEGLDDLSSTALLASGVVARNLRDVSPPLFERMKDDLERVLANGKGEVLRANAIDAIANAGLEELGEEIGKLVTTGADAERVAAISALPALGLPDAETIIATSLVGEKDAQVRAAAARTIGTVGIKQPETVRTIATVLPHEADPSRRAMIVGALAAAAKRLPEAREATLAHVAKDGHPDVLAAAGRHLGAAELSARVNLRGTK